MSYEDLGVGIDLESEILKSPIVFDLLISFFYVAAHNHKRIDLMFPSNVHAFNHDGTELNFLLTVYINPPLISHLSSFLAEPNQQEREQ
jgi:hypothetical protein